MRTVVLPGTDLKVSRLSFGTAKLHHLATSAKRQAVLEAAFAHGFTHFDTAPYYGHGLAELELGRFLRSHADGVTVASKFGLYPPLGAVRSVASLWLQKGIGKLNRKLARPVVDWSLDRASASLEGTLRRLRREFVDVLFLHEPDPRLFDADETLRWLERQREAGKVRYWGLAGRAEQFDELIRRDHGLGGVLQVCDGDISSGRAALPDGRVAQITYGCLTNGGAGPVGRPVSEAIRGALRRTPDGSVLVSTRRKERVGDLAAAEADQS